MKKSNGLKQLQHLDRKEYFDKNIELSKKLWETQNVPTVYDIIEYSNGEENDKINNVFEFFDNENEFKEMVNNKSHKYTEEESFNYIQKVISANNDDISAAGYFYKLLMASADDFRIISNDCNSEGVQIKIKDLTEDIFKYRVKFSYVNEYKNNVTITYNDFIKWAKENKIQTINVRTPLTCKHFDNKERGVCKKCAGKLPDSVDNIGTFTALMVTETATQSALSSMNKGVKEDINSALKKGYNKDDYSIESIREWINEITDNLQGDDVSARFYEIALLSRVRLDSKNNFLISSFQSSINYSGNLFGSYIFSSKNSNLQKMIKEEKFYDNSIKLAIALNSFKNWR